MRHIAIWSLGVIALGSFCAPMGRAAGLILNGDFATGDFTDWTATTSGDPYYTTVSSVIPKGALFGAYYDDTSSDVPAPHIQASISQSFNTVVGQEYTISFIYGEYDTNPSFNDPSCGQVGCYLDQQNVTTSNDPDSNPWAQNNNLNVLAGGLSVFSDSNFFTSDPANNDSLTNPDNGQTVGDFFFKTATTTFTATGTTTTLEFDADDYQQGVILNQVDVEAVATTPEPGTVSLLSSALLGLGFLARRRNLRRD